MRISTFHISKQNRLVLNWTWQSGQEKTKQVDLSLWAPLNDRDIMAWPTIKPPFTYMMLHHTKKYKCETNEMIGLYVTKYVFENELTSKSWAMRSDAEAAFICWRFSFVFQTLPTLKMGGVYMQNIKILQKNPSQLYHFCDCKKKSRVSVHHILCVWQSDMTNDWQFWCAACVANQQVANTHTHTHTRSLCRASLGRTDLI